jgi:hypothetical protein
LGLYLLALGGNGLLTYSFTVEQDDECQSPDFIITEASGAKVGLRSQMPPASFFRKQ